MSVPISPPPARRWHAEYLPAYVGNGVIGLRAPRIPFLGGVAIVNGFAGIHPADRVEGFARAPYPLVSDIRLGRTTLSQHVDRVRLVEQVYDFSCGELLTRLRFDTEDARAEIDVVTFCSRTHPTVVAQEIAVRVDRACDLTISATVDPVGIPGHEEARDTEPAKGVNGSMRWVSHGGASTCGLAYATEFLGASDPQRGIDRGEHERLSTTFSFRARANRPYRLRQLTSLIPEDAHHEPDRQAIRLVYAAGQRGFEELRAENRAAWEELWQARIRLTGASRRWQALADAAFFYLHSSAHPSSLASTSMFGLSYWPDYHYYRGHVMWDIEAFAVPPLLLTDPHAARTLLDFRADRLPAARRNAQMAGFRGAQFPWESSSRLGDEAAPDEGAATAREHHVSLDVAFAFAQYVHATGDMEFARTRAWPVLHEVATWIESRVTPTRRGFEIHGVTGVAEKEHAENNSAFVNLGATAVLREAIALAERIGAPAPKHWGEIGRGIALPLDRRSHVIRNYDGHRATDEKGETPEAAAGILLFGHEHTKVEQATYRRALELADGYVGAPMLSALLGVFAARVGDRARSLELFERGYGEFILDPFRATAEYSPTVFPDRELAGPFAANIGGFLSALLYGLTGVRLGPGEPANWGVRRPSLPAGWGSIEVDRIWVRGRPATLFARHGDDRSRIEVT